MKAVKIILWLIGLLLVLAVGAVVALTNLVDPNDYKPKIASLVKESTGRDLDLQGDLKLTFFPWLGVKTGQLGLSNREGFGSVPMLAVDDADIKIKLIPLLKKEIEIDTVVLIGPQINLSRKADGSTNWDDLVAPIQQESSGATTGSSPPDAALVAGLAVQGVSIQDGQVSWDDRMTGQSISLTALNLNTGKLVPGEPLDIDLSVDAASNMLPEPAAIKLVTTAQLTENFESVSLQNTEFQVAMQSNSADLSVQKLSYAIKAGLAALTGLKGNVSQGEIRTSLIAPSLNFNLSDESMQLPSIELEQDDFKLAGKINGSGLLSAIDINGSLQLSIASVAELLNRNALDIGLAGMAIDNVESTVDFTFSNNVVGLKQLSADLELNQQPISLSIPELGFDVANEALKLPAFEFQQDDFKLTGNINGSGLLSAIDVSGGLKLSAGSLADLLQRNGLEIELAGMAVDNVDTSVDFTFAGNVANIKKLSTNLALNQQPTSLSVSDLRFDLTDEAINLPAISLTQGDFTLAGSVTGAGIMSGISAMTAAGTVDARIGDIKDLLERNRIEVELPPDLVKSVATSFNFNLVDNDLKLSELAAVLDEMTINGRVNLNNLESPGYQFDLAINELDIDRLISPSGEESADPALSTSEQLLLPVAPLQGLDIDGHVTVGRLRTTGIVLDNVDLTVRSTENVLSIEPLTASLFGGSINATLSYDVSGSTPVISSNNDIKNVDVGALLKALEITDAIDGRGAISNDLTGIGMDFDQVIASLNGGVSLMLLDGAVKGYDLQSTLIKIQDAFKGQSMTEENRPDAETRFAELSADFNVVQGVFQTENMSMKAPAFRVNGRGTMDLPRQNLDYKLDVSVVESLEGQGGQSLDKLKGITIPLKVYGALDAPSYALDLGGLLKAQASKELKKRLLEELVPIEAESDAGIASAGPTDQAAQEEVETDPKEVLKKELKKSLFKAFGLD